MDYDLVCFSHLRWDGVYQRPQHLLSRLARNHRVLIIEEPEYEDTDSPYLAPVASQAVNVSVFRPRMRAVYPFYVGEQVPIVRALTQRLLVQECVNHYVVWLYTPMALPVAETLTPAARVFDCMDELSNFRFAPEELPARDRATMQWAELVLTGGRSLYMARRLHHSNIHCFPSSVDASHFGRALDESTREPENQRHLLRPRLGFFGVIDERLDFDVVTALATTHSEWQIVMVGPFAKLNPEEVPHYPNIHYLGQQAYASLPGYLKGWDVALVPFALNEATRFLSPTKVLEYMAAGRPVVSAPIADLLQYHSLLLADGPRAFVAACEQALGETPAQRAARGAAMRVVVEATSWDATAAQIETLIDEIVARR